MNMIANPMDRIRQRIPDTTTRVVENTPEQANARIRQQTELNIQCAAAGGPEAIARRLRELDQEWNIERMLELNAAGFSLAGLILGTTVNRAWYGLSMLVAGFLAQHAVQGWCPPVPVLRRLGFRTPAEIEQERYALKALRGDFQGLSAGLPAGTDRIREALQRICE